MPSSVPRRGRRRPTAAERPSPSSRAGGARGSPGRIARPGLNPAAVPAVCRGTGVDDGAGPAWPASEEGCDGGQARAFWLREPGVGEIRSVDVRGARSGRGARAHAALRREPRHRDPRLPRRGPRGPAAEMRAPFQEGDFPGPVKYGYLNVGGWRRGPREPPRPHRLLPLPAPDRLRRPCRGGRAGARRRAARAGRAGRHRRDRRQRPVGCRAARRRPRHRGGGRHGGAVRRPAARRHPRGRGDRRRRRPGAGGGRHRARGRPSPCRPTPPAGATSPSTRARLGGRAAALPRAARGRRARCSTSAGTATPR